MQDPNLWYLFGTYCRMGEGRAGGEGESQGIPAHSGEIYPSPNLGCGLSCVHAFVKCYLFSILFRESRRFSLPTLRLSREDE